MKFTREGEEKPITVWKIPDIYNRILPTNAPIPKKESAMNFTSHDRKYTIDRFGVVTQTDHRPFTYDPAYSAIYDSLQYRAESDYLQALRLGFATAAHGKRINSIEDIGFGNGAFMLQAKKSIDYVYGVDVTGVKVDGCYILPEIVKADVITFHDCLEHIPNIDFVRDLPCETISISLPYCHFFTQGLLWFDTEYPHRKPDEHIRHFNEFSLSALMDSYGWKTVAVSGLEDIVRKSKHGLQNILSMAFKRK